MSPGEGAQVHRLMTKVILFAFVVLFTNVNNVECSVSRRRVERREVHRIVIIPERVRGSLKKRPTKSSPSKHIFSSPDSTRFGSSHDLGAYSYQNDVKMPMKTRYHELPLPDQYFRDNLLDGASTVHVYHTKNGWKPMSMNNNQFHVHPSKYNFMSGNYPTISSSGISSPGSSSSSSSSTSTSRRPSSSHKTKKKKKMNRSKSRYSTTRKPPAKYKAMEEYIDLTTAYPQPLPPVQNYLSVMSDLHEMADQSQSYPYQNVLVRPRLKNVKVSASVTSTTTVEPKTIRTTTARTKKPYEVYENIDEDVPSSVATSGNGKKLQINGKRMKQRRQRPKTTEN